MHAGLQIIKKPGAVFMRAYAGSHLHKPSVFRLDLKFSRDFSFFFYFFIFFLMRVFRNNEREPSNQFPDQACFDQKDPLW